MVPPPPLTPPRKPSDGTKMSSSKNNNSMNDGQEFGLVPKYLWKKHQHQKNNNSTTSSSSSSRSKDSSSSLSTASTITSSSSLSSFSPNSSSNSSSNNKDSQRSNASTLSSTDPNNHNNNNAPTTIMMKDTEIVSSSSSFVVAKEADDNVDPTSAKEEISKLLQETNDILAKQWSVAKLVDSKAFERQKEIILRTEHYQTKAAADRIHGNLECKSEWFLSTAAKNDPSFLGSPISLQHVSKQQEETKNKNNDNIIGVEDGHVRLLPVRDLAGRAIVYYRFDPELYNNNKNQFCKILYYMLQSALEDEETVNKGIVLVVWNQKKKSSSSTSSSSTPNYLFGQFFEELLDPFWQHWSNHIRKPFKIAKLHYCTIVGGGGNPNNHDDDTSVPYSIQEKQDGDVDLRIHKGSLHECLHGLVTYGIPSHFLPPAVDDENDTAVVMGGSNNNHLQWIELRRRIESFSSSNNNNNNNNNNNEEEQIDFVLVPNREDVLLGKQRKVAIHGNIIFHQLIFDNKEAYYYNGNNNNNNNADNTNSNNNDDDETTPTTTTKDKLCVQIWNEIKAREGRFLQQVEGGQIWELLDKEDAVDKIRQAFNFICAQYFESDPTTMTPSSSSTPSSKQRQQQRHAFDWSDPFLNFNEIFNTSQCWNLEQNCRIGGTGVGASPAKKLFW